MRDGLIELLKCFRTPICEGLSAKLPDVERLADHLLAEGVIVPPCKVKPGDYVWFLLEDNVLPSGWYISKEKVTEVGIRGFYISDSLNEDNVATLILWSEVPGYVFFSQQEAEKALAERIGKNREGE